MEILKRNLMKVYAIYHKLYKNEYSTDVFGWHEEEFDEDVDPEKYECIIENGFNIFILMMTCIDLTGEDKHEFNDDETKEIVKELH